jgi:hypothetical protein
MLSNDPYGAASLYVYMGGQPNTGRGQIPTNSLQGAAQGYQQPQAEQQTFGNGWWQSQAVPQQAAGISHPQAVFGNGSAQSQAGLPYPDHIEKMRNIFAGFNGTGSMNQSQYENQGIMGYSPSQNKSFGSFDPIGGQQWQQSQFGGGLY